MSEWYKQSQETTNPDPNIRIKGIKIETDIPMPKYSRRGNSNDLRDLLDKLEKGNSVCIPFEIMGRKYCQMIMSMWNSEHKNKQCSARTVHDEGQSTGTRIWRVE